jgi:hypothetical protein
MRKTPIPEKTTFAGENTCGMSVRGQILKETTSFTMPTPSPSAAEKPQRTVTVALSHCFEFPPSL